MEKHPEPSKEDVERMGNYAAMLLKDQNIDRRKCKRVVPLEVLSLGYSRTGTMSMQNAFKILGYPNPYHFSSLFGNVQDCDMWVSAVRAKYDGIGTPFGRSEFDQLLGHVGAITDAPAILFWRELLDAYPEAKVVLVERDIDSWSKSWDSLVTEAYFPLLKILTYLDPFWFGRIQAVGMTWMRTQVNAHSLQQARDNGKEMYRNWYKEIRETIPKERMLEYKLGSGWGPLCEFLGKEVPGEVFPHSNEREGLKRAFEGMGKRAMGNAVWNLGIMVGVVVGVAAVGWNVWFD